MSDKPVYLKAPEVAAKLGWHIKTVYRNQELPRVRIGGSVWWIESQVDAFLAMHAGIKPAPRKRLMRRKLQAVQSK